MKMNENVKEQMIQKNKNKNKTKSLQACNILT